MFLHIAWTNYIYTNRIRREFVITINYLTELFKGQINRELRCSNVFDNIEI